MTERSVAFDRAAGFYDRTRAVDDAAMARTIELLATELRDRGRVLEVGVGTGLLAVPLHRGGLDVHGLDISAPMLRKIAEKTGGTIPFPVALGDATRQPFCNAAFGAAYLRWVLHLVPNWRDLLAEVRRVVAPGGVFLANLGAYDGPRLEIQRRFGEITGVSMAPVGLAWGSQDELDREMTRLGASVRELASVPQGGEETIRSFLDEIRDDRFSWTWRVPAEVRLAAVEDLEPWAAERFGDLDASRRWEHASVWRAYDLG